MAMVDRFLQFYESTKETKGKNWILILNVTEYDRESLVCHCEGDLLEYPLQVSVGVHPPVKVYTNFFLFRHYVPYSDVTWHINASKGVCQLLTESRSP